MTYAVCNKLNGSVVANGLDFKAAASKVDELAKTVGGYIIRER